MSKIHLISLFNWGQNAALDNGLISNHGVTIHWLLSHRVFKVGWSTCAKDNFVAISVHIFALAPNGILHSLQCTERWPI